MPLPDPQLDDRDFDTIVADTKARIPSHTPEWNNFNDSDPGITLIQLFSFMTENLLYRSNRIPDKNRLKFLSLLGIPLRPASPGRGLVTFENERGIPEPIPFEAGRELRAGNVPFITRNYVEILPVTAAVFYKKGYNTEDVDSTELTRHRNLYGIKPETQLTFYETVMLEPPEIGKPLPLVRLGTQADTIDHALWVALLAPKGTVPNDVSGQLAGQTLSIGVYPHIEIDMLKLEAVPLENTKVDESNLGLILEIAFPGAGNTPPRYQRLEIENADNVLELPGVVQVKLPDPMPDILNLPVTLQGKNTYPPLVQDNKINERIIAWLRIRLPAEALEGDSNPTGAGGATQSSTTSQPNITWVGVNAAKVIQALPVVNERLGVGTGTPEQSFKVPNTPVILVPDDGKPESSAFRLEIQNDKGGWDTWQLTDDLYAAKASATVYSLDPEAGIVTFGDGLRGKRPPQTRPIRISYKYGGGLQGAVNIGGINKSPDLPGGIKIANPLATWGAAPSETVDDGQRRISSFLRHRDRLVTQADFKDITLHTPGVDIGRVEILPLFNPVNNKKDEAGVVTVMVIPQHDLSQVQIPRPDRLFLQTICDWLDRRRLTTTQIFVRGPKYIEIWVTVAITVQSGYLSSEVTRDVRTAVRRYVSPLKGGPISEADIRAGREGTGWTLEMELSLQDLAATVVRVEGVRFTNEIRMGFKRDEDKKMTLLSSQEPSLKLDGIELPWLVAIDVREASTAENPERLDASSDSDDSDSGEQTEILPYMPKRC